MLESKKLFCDLENAGADPDYALDETFIGNKSLYLECLKNFPADKNIQLLRDSLATKKTDDAIRAVHTLKGLSDSLGLLPLMDCAFTVLKDLRDGNLQCGIADMDELELAYAKFSSIINNNSIPL